MKRATLFLEAEPFRSAPGIINGMIQEELERRGYETDIYYKHRLGRADETVPLAVADRIRRLSGTPPADLSVHCDFGLWIRSPGPEVARKSMVIFHGLVGGQSIWIGNPHIDLYCLPSPYMRDVVASLLTLPDWEHRKCLDPRAFDKTAVLVPALPCIKAPEGDERLRGQDLPEALRRALDEEHVVGHAVQLRKADWLAVFHLLIHLNLESRKNTGKSVRLVIEAEDFVSLDSSLRHGLPFDATGPKQALDALGYRLEDLLIPVRHLSQPALFELFRRARFGLAFNVPPESFGFYVLESVFQGCPVFTNGVGNTRHSLPPGHGLYVVENVEMAFGDPAQYAKAARFLLEEIHAPARVEESCRRGRDYIARTYNREAFSLSLRECLARLEEGTPPEETDFDGLRIHWSPLVRQADLASGRIVSDYQNLVLARPEVETLEQVLGRTAGEAARDAGSDTATLQKLFSTGVLALLGPEAQPIRSAFSGSTREVR